MSQKDPSLGDVKLQSLTTTSTYAQNSQATLGGGVFPSVCNKVIHRKSGSQQGSPHYKSPKPSNASVTIEPAWNQSRVR